MLGLGRSPLRENLTRRPKRSDSVETGTGALFGLEQFLPALGQTPPKLPIAFVNSPRGLGITFLNLVLKEIACFEHYHHRNKNTPLDRGFSKRQRRAPLFVPAPKRHDPVSARLEIEITQCDPGRRDWGLRSSGATERDRPDEVVFGRPIRKLTVQATVPNCEHYLVVEGYNPRIHAIYFCP
jgi:hypothetical protein